MKRILILSALLLALACSPARADHPFGPGEKLTYGIFWTFIRAGTATLEMLPNEIVEGQPAMHLRALAQTTPFIDRFYKVRDSIESWVDPGVTRALLYKKDQVEGDYERHYVVRFDKNGNVAYRYSKGALKNAVIIPTGTFDPLSILILCRVRPLTVGKDFAAPVTDGEKCVDGQARVVRRETITTRAGEYDTLLIEPDVRDIGGVFRKSPNAKLQVWVTNDERRIPVLVKSAVIVGSFSMELLEYEPPKPQRAPH
jgi:hypothetical protein